MARAFCEETEFIHRFEKVGAAQLARELGTSQRKVYARRQRIETRYGYELTSPNARPSLPHELIPLNYNGTAVIFSDCHFWPNLYSSAFWVLLQVIQHVKPGLIILNGDGMDGAKISRHSRLGWDQRPTVMEELEACVRSLLLVQQMGEGALLYWNRGNHDDRFDTRLAESVPEFEGVPGLTLAEHFLDWTFQWGLMINENCVVKHRYKGTGKMNTMHAGVTIVTGHDHHLQVTPFRDYRGTRFGVQGGTLCDPHGPQFDYTEANPVDWQSGFLVANFDGPRHHFESVLVENGQAFYAGKMWGA